jgi:hypothetical protein
MSSKLVDAFVEISAKMSGLDSGLSGAEARVKGFVGGTNSLLSTIGLGLSAGAAFAGIAAITEKGSSLIETMSKVKQVFGNSSGNVYGFADSMAEQFGAVKGVTLDAAANIGLVGQAAGMSNAQSAALAEQMVRLADDAASFFNKPLDVALEKIRSGLVGEAEPLREFGVLLSDAAMKQTALEMGLSKGNRELTEQEKVMARVEIITKSLAKAQGDHGRTMDGYANQVKKIQGQWENYQASIGAGMSGSLATASKNLMDDGILAAGDTLLSNAVGYYLGDDDADNPIQAAADAAAGVQKGFKPTKVEKPDRDLEGVAGFMAALQRGRQQEFDAKKFSGSFGPGGLMGDFMLDMGRQAMVGKLDQQIADKQRQMGEWGGGHTMDSMSFLKAAQEKISKPADETAKKQLDEMIKMREGINKLVAKPAAAGTVVKGRVS